MGVNDTKGRELRDQTFYFFNNFFIVWGGRDLNLEYLCWKY